MSNEARDFYSSFPQDPVEINHSFNQQLGLLDYLNGSMDYDSLSKALGTSEGLPKQSTPPNSSSLSSSSAEEDSRSRSEKAKLLGSEEDDHSAPQDSPKKGGGKGKKKAEKKQKEARVAFMTKTEIDHLEDGYRWRKYGQKAVKNSPYPRSYYRCTTQKCTIKKRVERSFEDPSTVITTYEGQHNHPIPSTLRGHAAIASGIFSHPLLSSTTSPTSFLFPQHHHHHHHQNMLLSHGIGRGNTFNLPYNLNHHHTNNPNANAVEAQQDLAPDYGLLQDLVPSFLLKQEP